MSHNDESEMVSNKGIWIRLECATFGINKP